MDSVYKNAMMTIVFIASGVLSAARTVISMIATAALFALETNSLHVAIATAVLVRLAIARALPVYVISAAPTSN